MCVECVDVRGERKEDFDKRKVNGRQQQQEVPALHDLHDAKTHTHCVGLMELYIFVFLIMHRPGQAVEGTPMAAARSG